MLRVYSELAKIWLQMNDRSQSHETRSSVTQRKSALAAHMEGAKPSSPLHLPPLATPMRTVESETRKNVHVRQAFVCKRTLS